MTCGEFVLTLDMPANSVAVSPGTPLPTLKLVDLDGAPFDLSTLPANRPLVVAFLAPHCPYVEHIRRSFADFAREAVSRGANVIAINSNDLDQFPQDGPEGMKREIREGNYEFPYLLDPSQETALAMEAACTPDFFIFSREHTLVYHGQYDGSRRWSTSPVTGKDLRNGLEAALEGIEYKGVPMLHAGCSIKWKPGNDPND